MNKQIDDHLQAVESVRRQVTLLESIAVRIIEVLRGGGKVWVFGNGIDSYCVAALIALHVSIRHIETANANA